MVGCIFLVFCGLFLEFIGTQNLPQPLLLLGPQTQNKKREREESASDAAETNGKRAKLDDLVLPDFFDVPLNKPPPAPISTLTDEAPMDVDKKSSSPMPQRTASGMIIPPQVRTARPNTVTEDYGAWSTEKKVKKPSVQR